MTKKVASETKTQAALITAITSGQIKQILQICGVATEQELMAIELDKDRAQYMISANGEELKARQASFARKLFAELSVPNQFKNEEVQSNYGYSSNFKPKPIADQASLLCGIFPQLNGKTCYPISDTMPAGAEALYAYPDWQKIAGSYPEATLKVLAAINTRRRFQNYREGQIDERHLRQHARTVTMYDKVRKYQSCDITVLPAQLGLRHRGRSVRRARECFSAYEFGLGAFEAGCILLTHPERLQRYEDLWLDCAGDEFDDSGGDGRFDRAPCFGFHDDSLKFGTDWVSYYGGNYGTASAFLP